MSTQKVKSDAAARLAKKLEESKARAKAVQEAEEEERKRAQEEKSKKNGKSSLAVPADVVEQAPPEKKKRKAPAKRKKKAVSAAKEKGATQKRTAPAKKGKQPKIIKGLAGLIESKEVDSTSGLTLFQAELVKMIQKAGPEGMHISDILLKIWPQKKIEDLRQEAKENKKSTPDRWVRNAIRRPIEHGFITRVDGKGLYRFVEWKTVAPSKRGKG